VDGVSWQRCLTPACYAAAGVEASGGNARGKVELSSMPPAWDSTTPEGGGEKGGQGRRLDGEASGELGQSFYACSVW
jgi:hypothetical protein